MSDLDSVAAELADMLAYWLATGGTPRALLSQGAGLPSMTPSRDDLLQLVSQAPAASELSRRAGSLFYKKTCFTCNPTVVLPQTRGRVADSHEVHGVSTFEAGVSVT